MTRKLRLGLVGCGKRGIHVTGLFRDHPAWEVTTLMDLYPACTARAAERLGLADAGRYHDFDVMLREAPVDALFFACDPLMQVDLACRAMEAGRHACTEVPAAFTIDDCRRLVETVERTGCQYLLMEQTRHWGFIDRWAEMNRRGEFGHVCFAQGEYVHYEKDWNYWVNTETGDMSSDFTPPEGWKAHPSWRYEALAHPIYYLPHTLSPLLKVLDDRVESVCCMGTRPDSYTYPDGTLPWRDIEYALMHTAKDTVMCVGAGFSLPCVQRGRAGAHWYELRGTRAGVESPRCRDDAFRVWRQGAESYEDAGLSTVPLDADEEKAKSGHGGADFKPVESFTRAVLDNVRPEFDVYRAVETAAPAMLAAESALRGGAMLTVPDFRSGAANQSHGGGITS